MARNFGGSSADYLQRSSAVVAAAPLTLSCWFRRGESANNTKTLMEISTSLDFGSLRLDLTNSTGSSVTVKATAQGFSGGTGGNSSSSTLTADDTNGNWAGAVFASTTSRTAYADGTAGTTNTTSTSPGSCDRVEVGIFMDDASFSQAFKGDIAECGMWNVDLTADEMASLAKGVCPLLVRPASLVAYWPLWGRNSPEIELRNGYALTVTGTTRADHGRTVRPARRRQIFVPAAASGVAGDLSQTLAALTAAAAGSVADSGVLAQTLAALASSSAGAVGDTGTLSQTLATLASASAGAVAVAGSAALTLADCALSATGSAGGIAGSLAQTLADLTAQSAAAAPVTGTGGGQLAGLTFSSAGAVAVGGTLAGMLAALSASAAGAVAVAGSASPALAALTSSSTGAVAVFGSGSVTLGALACSSAGAAGVTGTLSQTLAALTCAARDAAVVAAFFFRRYVLGRRG